MLVSKIVPVDPIWTEQQATLFFNVRLPRILLTLMVGCCLACAGAAYQGTFQTARLPRHFGRKPGRRVRRGRGYSSQRELFRNIPLRIRILPAHRVIGAAYQHAGPRQPHDGGRARRRHGVVLFQAGVSYAKLVADPTDELADITYWLMGSLTGANMRDIGMVLPIMLIGCATLFALRWRINILTMGDDEAATMA